MVKYAKSLLSAQAAIGAAAPAGAADSPPLPWVPYKQLKKALKRGAPSTELLDTLRIAVARVEEAFQREARTTLERYHLWAPGGDRGHGCGLQLRQLCCGGGLAEVGDDDWSTQAAEVATAARCVRLYAAANATAVRKFLKKTVKQRPAMRRALIFESEVMHGTEHSGTGPGCLYDSDGHEEGLAPQSAMEEAEAEADAGDRLAPPGGEALLRGGEGASARTSSEAAGASWEESASAAGGTSPPVERPTVRRCSFLHSPLLVDLWALEERAMRGPAGQSVAPAETERQSLSERDLGVLSVPALAALERSFGSAPGSISRLLPISTASRVDEAEEDLADTLGCAVCLDVVHNAFGLACGHYCCARCLQQIARLPPGGDLQQAPASRRCPQCRQPGVFKEAMPLPQLNTLVRRRLGEKAYRQRKQREKRELQEARDEHDLQTNPMNALLALYAGGRSQ